MRADGTSPTPRREGDPGPERSADATAMPRSVGEQFRRIAGRWPECIALDCGADRLRYCEVDGAADEVAAQVLSASAPGPARVALLFQRPAALISAILGVLRAGKVYVPLDPTFPSARIAYILKDADASLLLCDSETLPLARDLLANGGGLVNVETCGNGSLGTQTSPDVDPDDLASLFYTSGSTGEPKGVCQNHRNLLRFARGYAEILSMRPGDRVSLLFSYSFSGSIPDIFGTLLSGATLCPFDVKRHGPAALARWVSESRITQLHLIPTLFRHLTRQIGASGSFPALRAIDLGGEAAYGADVAAFRRIAPPGCVLVHRLAATEASLITSHIVDADEPIPTGRLPVGRPYEDMEIRIEAADGRPLPPGETGEIVLRSRFLSPGYWRRPELSSLTFQSDPAGGDVRLYRTGDRGRLRTDGVLEHLGRGDSRVKIRGHTVELGEVEGALRSQNGVTDCVVVARGEPGADAMLVAFVSTRPEATLTAAGLRCSLRRQLPDYMVPARVDFLDAFPLSATGKVDRNAVLDDPRRRPTMADVPLPPRNPIESAIASIWQEELDLDTVGVHDDYFAIGGTSLQAVQIMERIEAELGRDLAPSILLDTPTIAGLAEALRRDSPHTTASLVVPLRSGGSGSPLFCFPGNGGEPLIFKDFAKRLDPDLPCYGVGSPGFRDQARPARSIEEYARAQLAEIREIQPHGPYHFAAYSFGCSPAIEIAARLQASGERVALLAMLDGWAPGHPRLAANATRPHLVLDGWMGPNLLERQRVAPWTLVFHTGKAHVRELGCRARELLGRPLSQSQRRRRRKRSAIRARNRYRPRVFDGRILLIRSARSRFAGIFDHDALRGWGPFVSGGIETRDIDCVHRDLLDPPHVDDVARLISAELAAGGSRPVEPSGSD